MRSLSELTLLVCFSFLLLSSCSNALPGGGGGGNLKRNYDDNNDVRRRLGKKGRMEFNNYRKNFNRIATFPVCLQLDPTCNVDTETTAEIVTVSNDGRTLVYSDSKMEAVGFVDISDPKNPSPLGFVDVLGEPTSVTITKSGYVIAGVNTSPDYVNPSGVLQVINMNTLQIEASFELESGQPDSIAASKDGRFVAIAIENERDEDFNDGLIPQLPPGRLVVLHTDLTSNFSNWKMSNIDFTGLDGVLYPSDPEPEFVDINDDNIAVVTLQENNGIVLVNLEDMKIIRSFSAGSASLTKIDNTRDGTISQTESIVALREPDGVAWLGNDYFATADEGDLDGGSRGFTIFDINGNVVYTSGNEMEHMASLIGHYPEKRSGKKGNEPENVEYAVFGKDEKILFVNSERANLVFVYDVNDPVHPILRQILPTGLGPEGAIAIPSRNLLVVASEDDARDDKYRSGLSIYQYQKADPIYPTLISTLRADGTPIPFSALSSLTAANPFKDGKMGKKKKQKKGKKMMAKKSKDGKMGKKGKKTMGKKSKGNKKKKGKSRRNLNLARHVAKAERGHASRILGEPGILYSITDSYYKMTTILAIDTGTYPASIVDEMPIKDLYGKFSAMLDAEQREVLINNDTTINIDGEGIAYTKSGGFWIAHEGKGTVGDENRPVESPNALFKLNSRAAIEDVIFLPPEINAIQSRFGFEGVEIDGDIIIVTFQRAWIGEDNPRIGIFNYISKEWKFVFYPLDEPKSQHGGWVGVGDISSMGNGKYLILERDNQAGLDAAIKRIYEIDLGNDYGSIQDNVTIGKSLYMDLMPQLKSFNGAVIEKVEGLAITNEGDVWINSDNDGIDDSTGEQVLVPVGYVY